ncbi:hypothetical protein VI01_14495 [Pantoea sp. SM3]|nr:hypothetical protein VI01_14495 [Pantoea sp. SM3]
MGRPVRKFTWLIVFIVVLIGMAKLDYYYRVSDNYISSDFVYKLAGLFGVFPDGESMMNFKDWVLIHISILISLIPFSIIRVFFESVIERCNSFKEISKRFLVYYFKVNVTALVAIISFNLILELIDYI